MLNVRNHTLWAWGTVLVLTAPLAAQVNYTFELAPDVPSLSLPLDGADVLSTELTNDPTGAFIRLNSDLVNEVTGYKAIDNMPPSATTGCEQTQPDGTLGNPNPGISGFLDSVHPNPAAQKLKLVDGVVNANVDSVLSDFAWPAGVFQFNLSSPTDIGEIRVFAANQDTDGRVFQNYDVYISTDATPDDESKFSLLAQDVRTAIAVCQANGSPTDGLAPNVNDNTIGATLTRVYNETSPTLATGVTSIRFVFYAVDNTNGVQWDEHVGPIGCPSVPNPAEYFDVEDIDGQKRGFVAPVIKEIDVLTAAPTNIELCATVGDEDGDGLADELDPDCFADTCPPENCTNGIDDDGLGLVDCDDPDCLEAQVCQVEDICDDGIDNDGDLLIDCEDPDCSAALNCQCNDPFADVEPDGDVDATDFAAIQRCLVGVGGGIGLNCECFDRSSSGNPGVPDGDITSDDLDAFFNCVSGPSIPVDPACDD